MARRLAAPLSAYLEAHAQELEVGEQGTLLTSIPSSRPVVEAALAQARADGWYAPELIEVAKQAVGIQQQRGRSGETRLDRDPADWVVDGEALAHQAVVVLDDVYTTGASMHSFAHALRHTGARRVWGVALVRVVSGHVYHDELVGRRERAGELPWSPERRLVGRWAA